MVTRRGLLKSIAVGAVVAPSMSVTLKAKQGTVNLEKDDIFIPDFPIGPETFTVPQDGLYQINLQSVGVGENGVTRYSSSAEIRFLDKGEAVELNENSTAYLIT